MPIQTYCSKMRGAAFFHQISLTARMRSKNCGMQSAEPRELLQTWVKSIACGRFHERADHRDFAGVRGGSRGFPFADGRRFRILAIVDDFTRECPALVPDTSLPGLRVVRELDVLIVSHGRPRDVPLR
jgi:hypothetical protein